MWEHLHPNNATPEAVFEPLLKVASQFGRPWSIAELRLGMDDTKWLQMWLSYMDRAAATHCRSEILGGVLLCLAGEYCREKSNEDSVWPLIRNILPQSHPLRNELFLLNGQPSHSTKDMIDEAARALNLRHAMDIEGTQQWFVTIKLQFGFTYRGASLRLAEWLVGLGAPVAVQYLKGDSQIPELRSDSFRSLWKALQQFRQGHINETQAREVLQSSVWVKPHWVESLLGEARARIESLGTGEWTDGEARHYERQVDTEDLCLVTGISLEWNPSDMPRLRLHLNREGILDALGDICSTELVFLVDGRRICQWLRQRDGSWAGVSTIACEPDKLRTRPNLAPKILAVSSGAGETLLEWDLSDSGLSEEVLVFDLEKGHMLTSGNERLERNRAYAIVSDSVSDLRGCVPLEVFARNDCRRKVFRLPVPVLDNISIVYDDFLLWQPVKPEAPLRPDFIITLSTSPSRIISLNEIVPLFIDGLPQGAERIELLIHKKKYDLVPDGPRLRTVKNIMISPELAAGQRRVRVRFSYEGHAYTTRPHIALRLLGAAVLSHTADSGADGVSLQPLKSGTELNRCEGTKYLRIWIPEPEAPATVFEGDCRIGPVRNSKIKLNDIPAHGQELIVVTQGRRLGLGVRCHDTGCVCRFRDSILGQPAQLCFSHDKEPAHAAEDGYQVHQWLKTANHKATLVPLPRSSILSGSNERLWEIHCSPEAMALVLTWKGEWLGAWHKLDSIRDYILSRTDLPEQDFAVLKWLRTPILHPTLEASFRNAVFQTPVRFLRSWVHSAGLPPGIHPHANILGCDHVVRHFLWDCVPGSNLKDAIAAIGLCKDRFDKDMCLRHLRELIAISLPLFSKAICECRRRCPAHSERLSLMFFHSLLRMNDDATKPMLNQRLKWLKLRALNAADITEERLEPLVLHGTQLLEQPNTRIADQYRTDLLRLGETYSGRDYLAARIISYSRRRTTA